MDKHNLVLITIFYFIGETALEERMIIVEMTNQDVSDI